LFSSQESSFLPASRPFALLEYRVGRHAPARSFAHCRAHESTKERKRDESAKNSGGSICDQCHHESTKERKHENLAMRSRDSRQPSWSFRDFVFSRFRESSACVGAPPFAGFLRDL